MGPEKEKGLSSGPIPPERKSARNAAKGNKDPAPATKKRKRAPIAGVGEPGDFPSKDDDESRPRRNMKAETHESGEFKDDCHVGFRYMTIGGKDIGLPVYAFIKEGKLGFRYHQTQKDKLDVECPDKIPFQIIEWKKNFNTKMESKIRPCIKEHLQNRTSSPSTYENLPDAVLNGEDLEDDDDDDDDESNNSEGEDHELDEDHEEQGEDLVAKLMSAVSQDLTDGLSKVLGALRAEFRARLAARDKDIKQLKQDVERLTTKMKSGKVEKHGNKESVPSKSSGTLTGQAARSAAEAVPGELSQKNRSDQSVPPQSSGRQTEQTAGTPAEVVQGELNQKDKGDRSAPSQGSGRQTGQAAGSSGTPAEVVQNELSEDVDYLRRLKAGVGGQR